MKIEFSSFNILLLLTLCPLCLTEYEQVTSIFLPFDVSDVSIPPKQVKTIYGEKISFAVGRDFGQIDFYDEDGYVSTSVYPFSSPVLLNSLDWMKSEQYLLATTYNQASIFSVNGTVVKSYYFATTGFKAAVCHMEDGISCTCVFDFNNRLQVYAGSSSIMNITVNNVSAMTLDFTGNYLYFFENTIRYVVSIKNRTIFNTLEVDQSYILVQASSKSNYEDITMAVTSTGYLSVFDDYIKLSYQYHDYIKKATFCRSSSSSSSSSSNEIVTFGESYILQIWSISYSSFENWNVKKSFYVNDNVQKIQCKDGNIISLSWDYTLSPYVTLFSKNKNGSWVALVVIIASVVVFFAVFGFVIFMIKKRRAKLSMKGKYDEYHHNGYNNTNVQNNNNNNSSGQTNQINFNQNQNQNPNPYFQGNNQNPSPYFDT